MIKINYTNGTFDIENPDGSPYQAFPQQVYLGDGTPADFKFFVECRAEVKFYQINPGVIPQSEQVMLDGRVLKRDSDYFIDYFSL